MNGTLFDPIQTNWTLRVGEGGGEEEDEDTKFCAIVFTDSGHTHMHTPQTNW